MTQFVFTIEAESADELRAALRDMLTGMGGQPTADVIPFTPAASAVAGDGSRPLAVVPQSEVNQQAGMTVEQLMAGMTLKETASTGIANGGKAAKGDYVVYNGDVWHVYATYRGRIVAANEANVADVLPAEACTPAPRQEPTQARPGTAAALLGTPATAAESMAAAQNTPAQTYNTEPAPAAADGSAKLSQADATALREALTMLVASEKCTAQAVFAQLERFGARSVDDLTIEQAVAIKEWGIATKNGGEAKNPAFGF